MELRPRAGDNNGETMDRFEHSRRWVRELKPGENLEQSFLLTQCQRRTTRRGSDYLDMVLQDRTGSVKGKKWDASEREIESLFGARYVRIRGGVEEFQDSPQIRAESVEPLDDSAVDPSLFLPSTQIDVEAALQDLRTIFDAFQSRPLRELLELFSLGVGKDGDFNYSEDDVKACARAFTGWNLAPTVPVFPYGRTPFAFRFDPADHDYGEKTFLGETGNWNGEDIVEIICNQPAAARFVARKLYDFFVADEPPVPAWRLAEPQDMEAIKTMEKAYFDSGFEITPMLRALFTSDFFKAEAVRYAKVKSPADVVVGVVRMAQDHTEPKPGLFPVAMEPKYMGMDLLNPPTVEGWHMGREWINSGSLIDRINFASSVLGNTGLPGIQSMINRLIDQGDTLSADQMVDGCLDLIGPMTIADETRQELVGHISGEGELRHGTESERNDFTRRVGETFQMIATTSEFQFG